MMKNLLAMVLLSGGLISGVVLAAEVSPPDLPPKIQVNTALENHLLVLNAHSGLRLEQANQHKWNSGNYEFNLRAGSAQRQVVNSGQRLQEWDVALERPLRLPNKIGIDQDIGAASVARADFALGDAHHEAGRLLLRLWFVWLREQTQVGLWQQQTTIFAQQAEMVEKRVKAGDAPKLELNLALAAQAQARVSLQQANLRAQMAANDLQRQFPSVALPETVEMQIPQAIVGDYAVWQARIMGDNHELGMAQAQAQVQKLLAQRNRADQLPDPTVGLRYASEMGGNEKITGVFLTVPISSSVRSSNAQIAEQQANIAADQAEFVKHRLQTDIYAAYHQAVRSFATWQQAHEAADAIRANAELISKAYRLGESSLSDSLSARRIAQEATLAENLTQLDANEARYRLQLDGHQLWAHEENEPQ
jgi:cobalt-zinc-cadmium efflux system outer membrane protein